MISKLKTYIRYSRREYKEYLKTENWRRTRARILNISPLCRHCEAEATQVHHLTYDRLCFERDNDLVSICDSCHNLIHYILKYRGEESADWALTNKWLHQHKNLLGQKIVLDQYVLSRLSLLDTRSLQIGAGFLGVNIMADPNRVLGADISKINFINFISKIARTRTAVFHKILKGNKRGAEGNRRKRFELWMSPINEIRRYLHL